MKTFENMAGVDAFNELFRQLVPPCSKAPTRAGEIVRMVSRIGYRYYNDGDVLGTKHDGCDSAGKYLRRTLPGTDIDDIVASMWGRPYRYDESIELLINATADYIDEHPELLSEAA